jgi:EAL domain-containing protein (putative c-di-GMP-specific phosphodiesterase class I)
MPSLEREFWFLEGFLDASGRLWRMALPALPLRIGRHPSCGLVLASESVSSRHAELYEDRGGIWLRDLGSRNGTYVNRERVTEPVPLNEGDLVHFADREFRLSRHRPLSAETSTRTGSLDTGELARLLVDRSRSLDDLIQQRTVQALFQPILDLGSGNMLGWELLSSGVVAGMAVGAEEMFQLAEELGRAPELSQLCRELGVGAAERLGQNRPRVFVNTHPHELQNPTTLLATVGALREQAPQVELVLEIHEGAVADVGQLRELADALRTNGVGLAFDDFGIGQSRLLELAASPPDYLKFAKQLIQGLDEAPGERVALISSLVNMARSLGSQPIAEGIERQAELDRCRDLGFQGVQGYLIGYPMPAGGPGRGAP